MIQMERPTMMADNIDAADIKARYDEHCKKLLSYKSIIAYILTSVTEEFRGMDRREAEKYIGERTISTEAVDPDTPDRIVGDSTENSFTGEGKRFFDIKFRAVAPDGSGGAIELIINIEAQNVTGNIQAVLKRGFYYCGRLISAQYGTEFKDSEYDKLKKVYSIWICLDAKEERENTIVQYGIKPEVLAGSYPDIHAEKAGYDMLSLIMINLGSTSKDMDGIIGLLGTLLLNNDVNGKKNRLDNDFGIPMIEEFDKEVFDMCNLSSYVESKAVEKNNNTTIRKLVSEGIMTMEQAAEFYKISLEKVKEICSQKGV
ncbi:MAG: hypothetical protein IK990_00820 [Ruminiclostridium sp.]|nr:hypothetical protein [Ruminiclostridium sp.]